MMDNFNIVILMATYNGELYVAEQIESILNQSITRWQLIIRDDGSSDGTLKIISEYVSNDNRITILIDDKQHLGVINNFRELIKYSLTKDESLFFFADQDDVWFPDKLDIFVKEYKKITSQLGATIPVLIHSDLQVVDSNLKIIHKSFMKCIGIKSVYKNPLNRLLIQNYVTGCSMACNTELLKIGSPFPENIVMHDWWLALCAASCGKIGSIMEQTICYRQHRDNQYGSVSFFEMINPVGTFFREKIWKDGKKNLCDTFFQSHELKTRLQQINYCCSKEDYNLIDKYSSCYKDGLINRLKFIFNNRIKPNHLFAVLFFYFRLICVLPLGKTSKWF